jgi:uncharacterized protein YkwD
VEYGMAENVAYGATTAKEVVSMWKGSSGHRKNMLGNYKYIGIGTARDKRGAIYYTEIFVPVRIGDDCVDYFFTARIISW